MEVMCLLLLFILKKQVLSPNLFKIFINDLPDAFKESPDAVDINGRRIDCLMYADAIIIFSSSKAGLHKRLDDLSKFCTKCCLEVNLSKTKVNMFNKPGKLLKEYLYCEKDIIECVYNYKYLGLKCILTF